MVCDVMCWFTATVPSAMDHQKPDIFAASSGLDDFDEGQSQAEEARDFADDIRRQIADEFARKQEIGGFEVSLARVLLHIVMCHVHCRSLMTTCVWRRLVGRSCA